MDEAEAIRLATAEFGLTDVTLIARGGQKVVCTALRGASDVVLKVVLLSTAQDPNGLERCAREVTLLQTLTSPNVVRALSELRELGPVGQAVAWLEERLDGLDLGQLPPAPATWPEVAEMMRGVAAGLAELHGQGVVHRDLSAGNVRLTSAGVWKIMDPGLAKHFDRTSITGLWQPGTPGYMSPEHAVMGSKISPASDVYCLGLLAWRMLTGATPTPYGGDPDQYRAQLLGAQIPSIQTRRPDLSPQAIAVIDQCLDRQPARRFLDAQEVVDALHALPN